MSVESKSTVARPAKRLSASQKRRKKSRNLQAFVDMTTNASPEHSVVETLQGKAGKNDALDVAESLRTDDAMPNRTLRRLLTGAMTGDVIPQVEMQRAVQRLHGACEAVDASDTLNVAEKAVMRSALTGIGTSKAFRDACRG